MKWYEQRTFKLIAKECDNAILQRDTNYIQEMYQKVISEAKDKNNTLIHRTNYYFFAYNCISALNVSKSVEYQEKRLYLIRMAIRCFEYFKNSDHYEDDDYINGVYLNLKVSESNVLDEVGRIIPCINGYLSIDKYNYIMSKFN